MWRKRSAVPLPAYNTPLDLSKASEKSPAGFRIGGDSPGGSPRVVQRGRPGASRGCSSGTVRRAIRGQATGDGGRTGGGRGRQGQDQEASSEERVDIKDRSARAVTAVPGDELVGIYWSRMTHGRLNDGKRRWQFGQSATAFVICRDTHRPTSNAALREMASRRRRKRRLIGARFAKPLAVARTRALTGDHVRRPLGRVPDANVRSNVLAASWLTILVSSSVFAPMAVTRVQKGRMLHG
jgi:hypothetical protein